MAIPWQAEVDIEAAFSLLAFILITIPLYWHMEAWNVGCVLYIFWMGSQNLIQFINKIVWRNNAINWAPVYCDITTRWGIASSMGVICASLVINRRLYHIANVSAVSITRADKRRNIITDLLIGLGIPVLAVILYWFYQGHRFNILEGVGCIEAYPNTILSYFLYVAWPIPIGLVSATYCTLTLRAFFHRRRQFNELMASNSNLTFNRYFRLMGLAAVEVLFTIPLTVYNIVQNTRLAPIYVWRGLADVHFGFSRVEQSAAIAWRQDPNLVAAMQFRAWTPIGCALLFFLFFGLAEEARKHYKGALSSIAKRVGITTFERSTTFTATGTKSAGRVTIPTFVQRRTNTRRGSLDSFSDRLSTNITIDDFDEKVAAPYSPVGSSGSSTFIASPVSTLDKEKADAKTEAGAPTLAPIVTVPTLEIPRPPQRVHVPEHRARSETPDSERGDADVPSSVRPTSFASVRSHSDDMV